MSYTLTPTDYRGLRTTLTRRTNKLRRLKEEQRATRCRPTRDQRWALVAAAYDVIRACDAATDIFEEKGYPDSWHAWKRAREDASHDVRFFSDRW